MDKLKELLTKIDPEGKIFTESVLSAIKEVLIAEKESVKATVLKEAEEAAEEKLEQTVEEKVKEALDGMDEEHSQLLKDVLAKIDEEHTAKLKAVYNACKTKFGDTKDEVTAEALSDFLDTFLKEKMPKAILLKEARLNKLESMYSKIREQLLVNDEYVQTEIKEAIEDAKETIEAKDQEINRLLVEKVEINKKLILKEAKEKLEVKTKDLSPKCKKFVEKIITEDIALEEIDAKVDEAVAAYKKAEKEEREQLINEAKNEERKLDIPSPRSRETILNESEEQSSDPVIAAAVNVLNHSNYNYARPNK